ncbi:MAG TPA: PAC2 family protein [Actinomycetales bacterium]|nr:PAC2 family protein [Actinomycetales bacterium]
MLDPEQLYSLEPRWTDRRLGQRAHAAAPSTSDQTLPDGPVLLHALTGFIDAGSVTRIVGDHLLEHLPHELVATFDADQLVDYRSRRPAMVFEQDHYSSYQAPRLELHELVDRQGVPFFLLAGPEPDVQWERFAVAVRQLVEHLGVSRTVAVHAIPMAVPHTRPLGIITHGTRPDLAAPVDGLPPMGHFPTVQVPGSAAAMLELRLGEWGHDAQGFVVQVPHYLADTPYPGAAALLIDQLAMSAGLDLPTTALLTAAEETRQAIAEHVAGSDEVARVVHALEQQYDAYVGARGRTALLSSTDVPLPSADELGAEVERFLANHTGNDADAATGADDSDDSDGDGGNDRGAPTDR